MATSTALPTSDVVTAEDIESVFTSPPKSSALTFVLTAWQVAGQIAMRGNRQPRDGAPARRRLALIQEQVDALLASEVAGGRIVSAVGYQARALGTYHLMLDAGTTYYAWASSARTWQDSAAGRSAVAQLAENALRTERIERMRTVAHRAEVQLGSYVDDVSVDHQGKHVLLKVTPGQATALAALVAAAQLTL